jgi:GAF domain-containing protein/HAMP domain-containing protein
MLDRIVPKLRSSLSIKLAFIVTVQVLLITLLFSYHNRTTENLVTSILVSVLVGTIVYFISKSVITSRIKSLSAAADNLASGDMTVKAEEKGSDEISTLAISFNALVEGISIWRNNLEEIAASRLKDLTALYEIVYTISLSLDLNKVLPNVLDRALENLRADKGAVVLVDKDGKTLSLMAHRGLSEESLCQIIESGQGCTGEVISRNDSMRIDNDGDGQNCVPGLDQDDVRSAIVVPVSMRGNVFGAFAVYGGKGIRFSDQDEVLLMTIGNQVGVAVENSRLYEKTLELAQADGLTGLANRRYLMERLTEEVARAQRYQTSLSVIILDLDKFKSFNDTYGHLKGDELLKAFGAMIGHAVRVGDIVGRYGGEEFCVVLPNTSIKGAVVIAER